MPLDNEPLFPFLFDHVLVQTLAWQTSILVCQRMKNPKEKISPTGISALGCFSRRSSLSCMLPCKFTILAELSSMEGHVFLPESQTKLILHRHVHSLASCSCLCPRAWLTSVRPWRELPGVPEGTKNFLILSPLSKCLQDQKMLKTTGQTAGGQPAGACPLIHPRTSPGSRHGPTVNVQLPCTKQPNRLIRTTKKRSSL